LRKHEQNNFNRVEGIYGKENDHKKNNQLSHCDK